MTLVAQPDAFEEPVPTRRASSRTSAGRLVYLLLAVACYIAYFRASTMSYGYPSYQEQLGEADNRILGIQNYLLAALGGLYILLDGPFLLRQLARSPAIAFGLLLILLTILESDDVIFATRLFLTTFFITLPIVAYAARFGTQSALNQFRYFCIFAVALNVLYTAAFPGYGFMGSSDAGLRGMFPHKNQFGPFMAVAFVMLFPSGRRPALENLIATGACLVALVSVVLSRSASAWVMVLVAPILFLGMRFVLLGPSRIIRSVIIAVFVLLGTLAVVLGYLYLFDSLLNMLGRDPTLTGRTKMWGFLLEDVWQAPYFGHGFAAYNQPERFWRFWGEFGWNAISTHNSYLEILLNVGFVVTIYWGFVLLKTARANLVFKRDLLPTDVVKQQIITFMILLSAFSQAAHFLSGTFFWLALIMSLIHDDYGRRAASGRGPRRALSRLLRVRHRQGRGSGLVIPGTATS
jgi:O-antigen ligase